MATAISLLNITLNINNMKTAKLILLLVLVLSLASLVIQNQVPWKVRFLWLSGEMSAIVVLLMAVVAGFSAGIISALLVMKRSSKTNKKKESK
jgi:uncharacterized integral membrane protein